MDEIEKYETMFDLMNSIKDLPKKHKLFLLNITEAEIQKDSSPEFEIFDEQANDIKYLYLLDKMSSEMIAKNLLVYMPLFNSNNRMLKQQYFKLMMNLEDYAKKNKETFSEDLKREFVVLFNLASNHPIFQPTEQDRFKKFAQSMQ